jgi:hypothetical protein
MKRTAEKHKPVMDQLFVVTASRGFRDIPTAPPPADEKA